MNTGIGNLLFALIRSAIHGTRLTDEERNCYSQDLLDALMKISSKHDISHLLVFGIKQNGLISKDNSDTEKCILTAIFRYQRIKYEYETVCAALEKAKIPFLPLKGSVLRKYYPEAWMRTSCDIDILVDERDAERAKSVLINGYGYTFHEKGSHDISLFSSTKIHIELHYDLVEDGAAKDSAAILRNVWDTAIPSEGFSFLHEMTDEYFYFYHIAHMAKHFENGGCGIRPFIDLWILDSLPGADKEKRDTLLSRGGLLKFADSVRKLSRIWLSGEAYDTVSLQLANYILRGGVYGSNKNRITVQQQKEGGRFKYAISKIFLPYEILKFHYPILQKHRWLTPIMEVRRWFKLIFCGHLLRSAKELKYNSSISAKSSEKTKIFLDSIGL